MPWGEKKHGSLKYVYIAADGTKALPHPMLICLQYDIQENHEFAVVALSLFMKIQKSRSCIFKMTSFQNVTFLGPESWNVMTTSTWLSKQVFQKKEHWQSFSTLGLVRWFKRRSSRSRANRSYSASISCGVFVRGTTCKRLSPYIGTGQDWSC